MSVFCIVANTRPDFGGFFLVGNTGSCLRNLTSVLVEISGAVFV